MGKRSNFEPRERDFYPTPFEAVEPLIPHLRGVRTFAEPCAGDGALIRHLESFGLRCIVAGDIATGQDALLRESYGNVPVITNPPYDTKNRRSLMHALILQFMRAAPFAWLLIDFDWSATNRLRRSCATVPMSFRWAVCAGSRGPSISARTTSLGIASTLATRQARSFMPTEGCRWDHEPACASNAAGPIGRSDPTPGSAPTPVASAPIVAG